MDKRQMLQEIYKVIYPYTMIHIIEVDGKESYLPISLARVLSALGDNYFYVWEGIRINTNYLEFAEVICERKLLTDTGSEAYLDDQEFNTILAIYNLIIKNEKV